jgi:hypothetical protein
LTFRGKPDAERALCDHGVAITDEKVSVLEIILRICHFCEKPIV